MNAASPRIDQAMIEAVCVLAENSGLDEVMLANLRAAHPGVHFTWCMDDDITVNAKPVVERERFKLYLVNSTDHCSVLTNDCESASGIVVAEVVPD